MMTYILRRLLESVPVLLGISVLSFSILHLIPGDPAVGILGDRATPENVERIREQLGLNRPLHVQYVNWMGNILEGDLGRSARGNVSINNELRTRFPATIELALAAMVISMAVGLPMGIIAAINRNTIIDTAVMMFALTGVSIPIFVLGLLMIYVFGVELGWLPFVGRMDINLVRDFEPITGLYTVDAILRGDWAVLEEALRRLALPALTLSTIPTAIIARITRSSMLETLNQDYIRTARAKGLRSNTIVLRHSLRNALLPIVTVIGLQLGALLSGAVLTETIFSWNGVGKWLLDSIIARDYPIVQAMTLLLAAIYIMINLLVDLLYAVIDPRIRYS
ncbi:MAG: ABC transporter permease [Anaerolineae bacterium]|nr:ABC transporter permease [Anaerolineae bacterium]